VPVNGRIIAIGSINGAAMAFPDGAAYALTKSACRAWPAASRATAEEDRIEQRIRVRCHAMQASGFQEALELLAFLAGRPALGRQAIRLFAFKRSQDEGRAVF
jgi:NAD(P)-dependent dehydrogenase (short-subunit alcohol dehydrogenase family)